MRGCSGRDRPHPPDQVTLTQFHRPSGRETQYLVTEGGFPLVKATLITLSLWKATGIFEQAGQDSSGTEELPSVREPVARWECVPVTVIGIVSESRGKLSFEERGPNSLVKREFRAGRLGWSSVVFATRWAKFPVIAAKSGCGPSRYDHWQGRSGRNLQAFLAGQLTIHFLSATQAHRRGPAPTRSGTSLDDAGIFIQPVRQAQAQLIALPRSQSSGWASPPPIAPGVNHRYRTAATPGPWTPAHAARCRRRVGRIPKSLLPTFAESLSLFSCA